MRKKVNEIRTPRNGVKIGERILQGTHPVVKIKQGNRQDTISLEELAVALYGRGAKCTVIVPTKNATTSQDE